MPDVVTKKKVGRGRIPGTVQLVIGNMDPELKRQFKIRCLQDKESMQDFMKRAIGRYLQTPRKE